MNRALTALAAMLAMTSLASAQESRAQITSNNNAAITPNGRGAITGSVLNNILSQIITGMGAQSDTNTWTGANTFSGLVSWVGVVQPGTSPQDALTKIGQSGGGAVLVKAGAYPLSGPLEIYSNTNLTCEAGAVFTANTGGFWTGDLFALENQNHSATVLTDSNISVSGCTFVFAGTGNQGAYHHIHFEFTTNVNVHDNVFIGGGDGTALVGSLHTVVQNNYMTNATNACWDQYNAPSDFVVKNNFCSTIGYGILATSASGSGPSGAALSGNIEANTINMLQRAGFAAIWFQGGTGGTSNTVAKGNHIYGDGTATFVCVKASGNSQNDTIANNDCHNSPDGQCVVVSSGSPAPADILIDGNTCDGITVSSGNVAAFVLSGDRVRAYHNRIKGGSYPYCFWMTAAEDVVLDNVCDANWTIAEFNVGGASTNAVASEKAGAMYLLATATADGTGNLVIGPGETRYNTYFLTCNNVKTATNNTGLNLRVGSGAGPTWAVTQYRYTETAFMASGGASNPLSTTSADHVPLFVNGASNTYPWAIKAYFSQIGGASTVWTSTFSVTYADSVSGPAMSTITGSASYAGATLVNAIQLYAGTGNIASGTCSLYGLNAAL